ncbi:MAG: response regulator [Candidatus Rokubacteria bacterium]|nr:response regulator [Candidatus Rokubacteria bacterium]
MIRSDAAVLIVDDEPGMCWALGHILKGSGIVSVTATSGQEALRLAERQRFRLAFVDAKLPDAEGLELARRMREADPGIRIVLVSGYFYGDDPEVLQATAAGVINGFVSKPFLHDEVRTIARAALAP